VERKGEKEVTLICDLYKSLIKVTLWTQTSNAIEPLFAERLFSALKRITKDFGLNFGFKDAGQPAKRLVNDRQLLSEIGFSIERQFSGHGKTNQQVGWTSPAISIFR
jgi:hypothetical protein